MPDKFLKDWTVADGVSRVVAGTIADDTAWSAGTVVADTTRTVTALDVGKLFKRLSDSTYWVLETHSPVAWSPFVSTPATSSAFGYMTAAQASQLSALNTLVGQQYNLRARLPTRYEYVSPGVSGGVQALGTVAATAGTVTTTFLSNDAINQRRRVVVTSSAGAGSLAEIRSGGAGWLLCNSPPNLGGFVYTCCFRLVTLATGSRWLAGMVNLNGNATNIDPLNDTTMNKIAVADNNDTGNVFFVCNNGSTINSVDTGIPQNTTSRYLFTIAAQAGSIQASWDFRELISGASASGIVPVGAGPQNPSSMFGKIWITNNTTATAVAVGLEYMEVCALD